jgi:hypothetical protein
MRQDSQIVDQSFAYHLGCNESIKAHKVEPIDENVDLYSRFIQAGTILGEKRTSVPILKLETKMLSQKVVRFFHCIFRLSYP